MEIQMQVKVEDAVPLHDRDYTTQIIDRRDCLVINAIQSRNE
jgi:hypothetical protein